MHSKLAAIVLLLNSLLIIFLIIAAVSVYSGLMEATVTAKAILGWTLVMTPLTISTIIITALLTGFNQWSGQYAFQIALVLNIFFLLQACMTVTAMLQDQRGGLALFCIWRRSFSSSF